MNLNFGYDALYNMSRSVAKVCMNVMYIFWMASRVYHAFSLLSAV
jgi:hypothetical protein